MPPVADPDQKAWLEKITSKISRSGYFFAAVLLHLVVGLLVATWVIFPAFSPPQDAFDKAYVPASAPPPPPPPPVTQATQVPTAMAPAPSTISTPSPTASFSVPLPEITPATATPTNVQQKMTQQLTSKPVQLSAVRLQAIKSFVETYRERSNVLEADGDPRNVKLSKFPIYLASYADGDWSCNVQLDPQGKIISGSLPNFVAKINQWSKGNIHGEVVPDPLKIGGPDLLGKRPPFIYFTGHKDFKLTDGEIKNLADYLQEGGCILGDNALPGRGSRFDVAFRREMKRVVPDIDKNFEPVPLTDGVFKSWFPFDKVPQGMNFYSEPLEHLDIDGKLAIFYMPNDYSDMFNMRILEDDKTMVGDRPLKKIKSSPANFVYSPLYTDHTFIINSNLFFRNFTIPSCLLCDKFGMNVIGSLLVRFDKDLLLTP